MPEYRMPEDQVYDRNGNPYWTCSCYIRSHSIEETAYETSKKLAKKYSAYKCICNICGLQDEYAEED
jgi:ribonuclease-3